MAISIFLALALATPEPLVWTKMANPDPHFVAPKPAPPGKRQPSRAVRIANEPQDMESAVENLRDAAQGRAEAAYRDFERQVREAEATIERARKIAEQAPAQDASPQR